MGRRSSFLKQKKSLGQVFLKTQWPVDKVVERLTTWKVTRVLEIGPGGGILTRSLIAKGFKVTAIEKDDRFVDRLQDYKRTEKIENFEVISSDVLKFDIGSWLAESGEPTAVVGNIPYNISSSIVLWILPWIDALKGVEFLVQLEFAMRVAAKTGTKAFGSLSVFTQLRSRVELECKVDRSCFKPIPKVDSALVFFRARPQKLDAETLKKVEQVSRLAFQQRRKTLRNALSPLFDERGSENCPIDLGRRPDSVSPSEFVQLAKYFFPE